MLQVFSIHRVREGKASVPIIWDTDKDHVMECFHALTADMPEASWIVMHREPSENNVTGTRTYIVDARHN